MDDQGPIPGDLGLTLLQLPLARAEGRLLSALGTAQRPVPHVTHWTGCHPQGPGSDVLSACLVAGMLWLSSRHRWATHSPSLTHVFEGRAASARCQGADGFPTVLRAACVPIPIPIPMGRSVPITSVTNTPPLPPAAHRVPRPQRARHRPSCRNAAASGRDTLLHARPRPTQRQQPRSPG